MVPEFIVGIFIFSLASMLHCVGMCGSLHYMAVRNSGTQAAILYNVFRLIGYLTQLFIVYLIGWPIVRILGQYSQPILLIAGLVLMLYVLFFESKVTKFLSPVVKAPSAYLMARMKNYSTSSMVMRPLIWGLANGFLPCGATYGAILLALASGNFMLSVVAIIIFSFVTGLGLYGSTYLVSRIPQSKIAILRPVRLALVVSSLVLVYRAQLLDIQFTTDKSPNKVLYCHSR